MELVNWSLHALDRIFSTRRPSSGERSCPGGTFLSGYVRDSWGAWQPLCLATLEVEDVEDIYIFVAVVVGVLLLGFGTLWLHRMMRQMAYGQEKTAEMSAVAVSSLSGVQVSLSRACDDLTQVKANLAASNDATAGTRLAARLCDLEKIVRREVDKHRDED